MVDEKAEHSAGTAGDAGGEVDGGAVERECWRGLDVGGGLVGWLAVGEEGEECAIGGGGIWI